jgi:hypothetical protein
MIRAIHFILKIPINSFANALLKLQGWLPVQLMHDFIGIDGISQVMTGSDLSRK